MTVAEQLTALGWVGLVVLFAALIVLGLWWGARLKRQQRADALFSLLNLETLADLLARLFGRR